MYQRENGKWSRKEWKAPMPTSLALVASVNSVNNKKRALKCIKGSGD